MGLGQLSMCVNERSRNGVQKHNMLRGDIWGVEDDT